jgi:hypothetical protein
MELSVRRRFSEGTVAAVGLALASVLAVGCVNFIGGGSTVTGSGPVVTENRTAGSFDKVESRNGINLVISIGSTPTVTVSAQQNIVPLVSTTIADGKLTASVNGSVISSSPITVTVVTPALTALALHDGTSATVTGIAADTLTLEAYNGAHANLSGTATNLTINADNGTLLQLGGLVATSATIDVANGVTGQLHATGTVTGSASDGVLLSVTGGAAVNVNTSNGAIITSQ